MNRVPTYYGREDEESEGVRTSINVSPLKPKTDSRAKPGVRFVKEPIVGTQSNANLRSKRAVAPSDNTPFKGVSNKTADDPNIRFAGLFTTAGSSWKNKTSNAQQETPSARSQFLSRRIKAREDLTPLVLPEISFRNSNTQNATSQSISTPLVKQGGTEMPLTDRNVRLLRNFTHKLVSVDRPKVSKHDLSVTRPRKVEDMVQAYKINSMIEQQSMLLHGTQEKVLNLIRNKTQLPMAMKIGLLDRIAEKKSQLHDERLKEIVVGGKFSVGKLVGKLQKKLVKKREEKEKSRTDFINVQDGTSPTSTGRHKNQLRVMKGFGTAELLSAGGKNSNPPKSGDLSAAASDKRTSIYSYRKYSRGKTLRNEQLDQYLSVGDKRMNSGPDSEADMKSGEDEEPSDKQEIGLAFLNEVRRVIKNKRHAEKNKMKKETKKLKRMMTNRAEDIDQNTKLVKTYYSESEDEKGGNKDEVEGESVLSNTVRKAKKHCRNERYREQAMIVEDFVNEKKRKKEITMKKLVQNTANPTQGLHQIFLPQNKSARARLFEKLQALRESTDKSKQIELGRSARKLLGQDLIHFLESYTKGEIVKVKEASNYSDQRSSWRNSTQGTSSSQADRNRLSSVYEEEVRKGRLQFVETSPGREEEDLSPDQKIANAVSLLLASYKINPATTGHDVGHEGKRSRSRGNHRLLKQKRQEELAEVNQFVESVQAELKKRSPDNKNSTISMKRKTEAEPLTLCRFPKRGPRSRDTLKNCSQNFSQSEQSQRNSVDSATSATQIKLSKCYHGLRNLQAAMDVYESGAPLPPWIAHLLGTGTQRSSTTVREGLANLAGIIRLRVDGVLREKVKAES